MDYKNKLDVLRKAATTASGSNELKHYGGILTDQEVRRSLQFKTRKRSRNVLERARDIVGGAARGAMQGARGR